MNFNVDPTAGLSDDDRSRFDEFILEFEEQWSTTALDQFSTRLSEFGDDLAQGLLREMILIDIERQWQSGHRVAVEDYLQKYPELGDTQSVPIEFVVAELDARAVADQPLDSQDLLARFPAVAAELEELPQPDRKKDTRSNSSGDTSTTETRGDDDACSVLRRPELPENFGRYRVIRPIARGGMGTVYLATDTSLFDRRVALKVPHFSSDSPEEREFESRFFAEARAASRLDEHPNLCSIYEIGNIDGINYISMAYVEGETLESYLRTKTTLDQREAVQLLIKVAEAIEYAHQREIIHRDLKLANIMINSFGAPVVMDFGLARLVSESESTRVTQYGVLVGTPAYMSPEQVRADPDEIHATSDIYSLGVVFYHLLTGRLPFEGSFGTILSSVLRDAPVPPRDHRPEIDPQLESICLKMMAKRSEDRYQSMHEVAQELWQWQLTPPFDVVPAHRFLPGARFRPWLVSAVLTALFLLAVIVVASTRHGDVRFEIEPQEISVLIDGDRFTVEDLRESKEFTPGPHRLAIEVAGVRVPLDRSFTIDTVEHQGRVKLEIDIDGVSFSADRFNVTRGEEHVMKIALVDVESPDAKPNVPQAAHNALRSDAGESTPARNEPNETALALNGIDSYVSIPDFYYDGSFPLTVESKLTPMGHVSDGHVLSNSQHSGFSLVSQKNHWCFYFHDLETWRRPSAPVGELGREVHLAGVYDGREASLFVDGRLIERIKVDYKHRPSIKHLFLGADPDEQNSPDSFFSGLLHCVRISKVARYEADFAVPTRLKNDSDTLAWYDFSNPSGEVLVDGSENGYNGTIHNASWVDRRVVVIPALDEVTLKHRWTSASHADRVRAIAVSPDGQTLASGSFDGTLGIWDRINGKLRRTIDIAPLKVIDLQFSPRGQTLAVVGFDEKVRLVDVESGDYRLTRQSHAAARRTAVVGARFSSDGDRVVTGGWDGNVLIHDVATGNKVQALEYPFGRIHAIDASTKGNRIAAAGDRIIQVWDATDGKPRFTLSHHCNTVMSVAFSADGKFLYSASLDGSCGRWDMQTGRLLSIWRNAAPLVDVNVFEDGRTVVTKDQHGTVRFWRSRTGQQLGEFATDLGQLGTIALADNNSQLVTGCDLGLVKLWDIQDVQDVASDLKQRLSPSGADGDENRVLYCDGLSSYIRIPNYRYDGTHPITIETWLRMPSIINQPTDWRPGIISQNDGRGLNLLMMERGFVQAGAAGCGNVIANQAFPVDRWFHLALTYDHPTLRLFVDGQLQYEKSTSSGFRAGSKDFIIAADPSNATSVSRHLRALFDEVRFSRTIRYRENFVPPSRHMSDADTILLYHFDDDSPNHVRDSSGNGFDGQAQRVRMIVDKDIPDGFDRRDSEGPELVERYDSFAAAFQSLASSGPTASKDFENEYKSDAGPKPVRWHAEGHLKIESDGGSRAWNALTVGRGLVQIDGRITADDPSWMVNVTNVKQRRGISISVGSDGRIVLGRSLFQISPATVERVLATVAPESVRQFNALGLAVHRRAIQVFWNGAAISDPIAVDFELTPGAVSLGKKGGGRVEYEQIRYWRPFDSRD